MRILRGVICLWLSERVALYAQTPGDSPVTSMALPFYPLQVSRFRLGGHSVMETNGRTQLPGALNLEIPDSVKREAEKCPFNFSCLTTDCCGSCQEICKVERPISKFFLWITSAPLVSCPYYVSFGSAHICGCPVRHYLGTNESSGAE